MSRPSTSGKVANGSTYFLENRGQKRAKNFIFSPTAPEGYRRSPGLSFILVKWSLGFRSSGLGFKDGDLVCGNLLGPASKHFRFRPPNFGVGPRPAPNMWGGAQTVVQIPPSSFLSLGFGFWGSGPGFGFLALRLGFRDRVRVLEYT